MKHARCAGSARRHVAFCIACFACCVSPACTPSASLPAPPPPPSAPPPVAPPSFAASAWGTFTSKRFELRIPLPDGHAWRIDDHHGPWLEATHAASESALAVRSWTEDGRATRRVCEERARLWRTFPDAASAESVEEHSIDAPSGFDTFVAVGVMAKKPGEPVNGFALAFGGHGHRCFAWAYTTTGRGPGAAELLGERLATMVERSLRRIVYESELTPDVREKPDFR
jgi:hypothetical protein